MKRLLFCSVLSLVACSGKGSPGSTSGITSGSTAGSTSGGDPGPTFTADIQPILAAHCQACHVQGGIAPFPLVSYQDAFTNKAQIASDVGNRIMPPWPPDDTCNGYQGDRSLSQQDISTVVAWATGAAPQGDPGIAPTQPTEPPGLSRVDLTLSMPAPYTPQLSPDDYHCFMLDWPETSPEYVTGFSLTPGDQKIVHHAIAFIAPPDQLASYEQQMQSLPDGGVIPSYTCFGGPGGMGALTGWLGVWTPGSSYGDLPAGTGVLVQPGSKIILQVHYNSANGPGESDLSSMQLKLDPQVDKPAALIPFTNPIWVVEPSTMSIPAGDADATHSFSVDPTLALSSYSNGVLTSGQPFTMYSSGAHMHLRGTQETMQLVHPDGGSTCLIDVPGWNFRWQGNYFFQNPVTVNPGDQISMECQWNNSAANQPTLGGQQLPVQNLEWGEDSEDEMCLGMFYVTQ